MKEVVKGLSILAVTAGAIGWMFTQDNDFEIAFLNPTPDAQQEALALQEAILQGDDPTSIQNPTAAGTTDQPFYESGCLQGTITTQPNSYIQLDASKFVGVIREDDHIYIHVIGQAMYLKMPKTDYSQAMVQDSVPSAAISALIDIKDPLAECHKADLLIGRVVTL